jgi:RNA polymerase sigma factor (sigma-70 family)
MEGSDREDRFRALYVSTRPLIVSYALRRSRTPEDAADVVAETFAIAWRRLDSVPHGDAAVPWLVVTARLVVANMGRRTEHRHSVIAKLGNEFRAALTTSVSPQDERALVAKRALERLSNRDREIIMLVAWEGLSDKDVGTVLQCSPAAARIRLHRARTRLVDALAHEEPTEKQSHPAGHKPSMDSPTSGPHVEEEQPS